MTTWLCCSCCRVRTHTVYKLGSNIRDDHAHPCYLCPDDGRGRQTTDDLIKLPGLKAA